MEATFRVRRFNPEVANPESYWQEYQVDVDRQGTVLDGLIKIREEVDGTLTLRCSCRSAICGSCSMRINGHATLACKAKMSVVPSEDGVVIVEPMGNQPVIKDLVVDMDPFWDKVKSVRPWLRPAGPEPEGEYLASNDSMVHLSGVMNCIMCGACVSDCTVLEVDPNFLGPAALAKAYRFVADPRDGTTKERLDSYSGYGGIWDCTRCFECVQVCPKDVAPMERIMVMRENVLQGMAAESPKTFGSVLRSAVSLLGAVVLGTSQYEGARFGTNHARAFEDIVGHSGRLDELRLTIKSIGIFNFPHNLSRFMGLLPVALRAGLKGKVPPLIHTAIPEVNKIRRIHAISRDRSDRAIGPKNGSS